jgi:hypothetical protein
MRERPFSSTAFPAASCATCGTTVLTHINISETGDIKRLCVRCDRPITAGLQLLSTEQLEEQGYAILSPRARNSGGCRGGCACSIKAN